MIRGTWKFIPSLLNSPRAKFLSQTLFKKSVTYRRVTKFQRSYLLREFIWSFFILLIVVVIVVFINLPRGLLLSVYNFMVGEEELLILKLLVG